jgi:hypothetical protein
MDVNTENTRMEKKVRGRPRVEPGGLQKHLIQIKVGADFLAKIDDWCRAQPGKIPPRTEAVRRLIETHPEIVKQALSTGKKR